MERPDINKPHVSAVKAEMLVAKTQSIEEAEAIAKRYESEGFEVEIRRISQAGITMYEVWAGRKPDVFSGK